MSGNPKAVSKLVVSDLDTLEKIEAELKKRQVFLEEAQRIIQGKLKEKLTKKVEVISDSFRALKTFFGKEWDPILNQDHRAQIIEEIEMRLVNSLRVAALKANDSFGNDEIKRGLEAADKVCLNLISLCETITNKLRHNAWQNKDEVLEVIGRSIRDSFTFLQSQIQGSDVAQLKSKAEKAA